MRKVLIWIVVIAAVLWGGYWVVGSRLIDRGLRAWVAAERTAGRTADYEVLRVQGFPSRFDIHAEGLHLHDPVSGWGWQAPVVELAALSYQPQHYIAVLPHEQRVETPFGPFALRSDDMRASLVFSPGPSFVLDRMTFVAGGLSAEAGAGLTLAAERVNLATTRAAATEFGHRLGAEVAGLSLPQALLDEFGEAAALLPPRVERLHLDATVDFDRRWDRQVLEGPRPQPVKVHLDDLTLVWGEIGLGATGTLEVDAAGLPSGTVQIVARNWRRVLDILVAAGRITPRNRTLVEAGLSMAGAASGSTAEELRAPLTFRDGLMSLGALPLGPAPRLAIR